MLRPIGILLVALSLLAGPGSLLPLAVECPRCADHCPMKKPRLPCHSEHGSQMPCHSGPRVTNAGCNHGGNVPPLVRDFALLAPPAAPSAGDLEATFVAITADSPEAPLLEPPIDPPRFSFAV